MDIEEYIRKKTVKLGEGDKRIKNYQVFDFNYIPEKPLIRHEARPVADAILRYGKTRIPNNILIIGSRGSGKTLLVKSLASALVREQPAFRFLYINCRHHNTSFKILAEILQVRPRGYGLDELWTEFEQRYGRQVVLILDEVDLLSEKDRNKDILYLLSRSVNAYMVILLSNNPRFHGLLDPSVKSTLQPEIVHFRNYNADQVGEILGQRCRLGLVSWDDRILQQIAALTVRDTNSDIRVAIKGLYFHALEPERTITGNFNRARRDIAADIISDLNDKNLIILKASQMVTEPFVKTVYESYRRLSETCRETPFSYVYFYNNLFYLQSLGLILLVSTKVRRAYTNLIQPLFEPETLESIWNRRFG